ncbi:MAG: lipoyl synthase [Halobacteriovoraceae bacterium]|nr:lipoyl synthase [Halobacteriovoraceae bacterium]|tara:strand:- start:5889 stop:6821 length:933 start_codon:yes stop_codon:yes gene_type:complete
MEKTVFKKYGEKNLKGKPRYLKAKIPKGDNFLQIKKNLRQRNLYTVCEEAKCPNLGECWDAKVATMMILGDTCTRACKFCHVKTGNPKGLLDLEEPKKASEMVAMMGLKYLVVTSVDRDDLDDFGASHFAAVVDQIAADHPDVKVEVLIPDFNAQEIHMHTLAKSNPFVIAQNLETVKRLTHPVRDRRASYEQTLKALNFYHKNYPHIATKSSLMVGLGETKEELTQAMVDLKEVGVKVLTFGQYLRPTLAHLEVQKYYEVEEFDHLKKIAYDVGFDFVASGPMVRSSYKASDYLDYLNEKMGSEQVWKK